MSKPIQLTEQQIADIKMLLIRALSEGAQTTSELWTIVGCLTAPDLAELLSDFPVWYDSNFNTWCLLKPIDMASNTTEMADPPQSELPKANILQESAGRPARKTLLRNNPTNGVGGSYATDFGVKS